MAAKRVDDPERVTKKTVDNDGRIYIGRDRTGEEVYVVVAEDVDVYVEAETTTDDS